MAKSPIKLKGEERARYEAEQIRKKTLADIASGQLAGGQPVPSQQPMPRPQQKNDPEAIFKKPEDSFLWGQEPYAARIPLYEDWQKQAMQQLLMSQLPALQQDYANLDRYDRGNPLSELLGPRLAGVFDHLNQGPQDFPSYGNQGNYGQAGQLLGALLAELGGRGAQKAYNYFRPQEQQQSPMAQPAGIPALNQLEKINPNTGYPYREDREVLQGPFGREGRENF